MLAIEKKNFILKTVNERSAVSVRELTELLNVSEVTIRKILNALARKGMLRRTHGGAVSLSVPAKEEDLKTKRKTNLQLKRELARKAYELIEDYDTIYIDAGSTTLELVRCINSGPKRNITIVTNALNLATELLYSQDIDVLLTGGQLRHGVVSCVGPLAEKTLNELFFNKAFMGTNMFSAQHGATTHKLSEAHIKQCAIKSAHRAYLLGDSSKYGRACAVKIAPLQSFAAVITDSALQKQAKEELESAGVPLLLGTNKLDERGSRG